jgi:hypothetical protein
MNPTNATKENMIEPNQAYVGKWVEDRDVDECQDS